MSDTPENGSETPAAGNAQNGAAQAGAQTQVKTRILAQYIRDLSFENILAQKGVTGEAQPDIQVGVKIDARKRQVENQYEVITKLQINSKTKNGGEPMFLMEMDYAGIFHVEGVPEDQLHPYLLIECPRMIFPFVRRVVADVTRDGGFPPLMLDTMDFVALYRAELARRVEAQKGSTAEN